MNLSSRIRNLRAVAIILFLTSSLSLVGSLLSHNYLVGFNFHPGFHLSDLSLEETPGSNTFVECDSKSSNCNKDYFQDRMKTQKNNKLNQCFKYELGQYFKVDNKKFNTTDIYGDIDNYNKGIIKNDFKQKKISLFVEVKEKKDLSCIKNFKSLNLYNIFPIWHESIYKLKKGINLGSGEKVNPFIYGELSISNMVKRYPINFIFKPLLFIASILMIAYWVNYNFLFKKILKQEKNYFYYFGLFSAIFLFLHVLFLGSTIENEIFQKIRRLVMILFILCELIAQVSLTRQLYKNSKNLTEFCYLKVINLKIIYIILVSVITFIILFLLIFYNFQSRIDYILEWNYFLGLLIFYFLSSIMWKKITN